MATNETDFLEKRETLKRELAAGEYNSQLQGWLEKAGQFIQERLGIAEPFPYWLIAVFLMICLTLIISVLSLFLGEFQPSKRSLIPTTYTFVCIILLILLTLKPTTTMHYAFLRDHFLDSLETGEDLDRLLHWLDAVRTRMIIFYGLAFSIIMTPVIHYFVILPTFGFSTFGFTIVSLMLWFETGMILYSISRTLGWFGQLGQYRLKLYSADPSHSEIIARLSELIRKTLYIWASNVIAVTLASTFLNLLTSWVLVILIIFMGWFPTIITFAAGQYSLSNLIANAKWQELNRVQARVERLKAEGNMEEKDTMEAVKRLIEYHALVQKTPNSAINLQASLNFLNSLLLPVLAFVLSNLDTVLAFFK